MNIFENLIKEFHEEVVSEVELQELDQYFEEWKRKASARNIEIETLVCEYLAVIADGETLRNPQTNHLERITFEQQKRIRSLVINQIIYCVASAEIDQTLQIALANPQLKKFSGEIKGDADYLRKMILPEISLEHPMGAAHRYRSMSDELTRITQKVLSKL